MIVNSDDLKGYFDYNATTPVSESVAKKMLESIAIFGNASSNNTVAQLGKSILLDSRECVARLLGCDVSQIAFTSGGSEANNWALKSYLFNFLNSPGHVITTSIEHPSVLDTLNYLSKKFGFDVTYLDPKSNGSIAVEDLESSIRPNTQLISVMYANNETGVIQPVYEIGRLAKDKGIKFHVDGVQVIGKQAVTIDDIGADFLSFSAHKFYGPKGIGGLYIRNPNDLDPLIHGGGQEMGLRAGTENLVAISGMAQAADDCVAYINQWSETYASCRDYLLERLRAEKIEFEVNGLENNQGVIANTLNISITGVRGEALAAFLDKKFQITVSIGSACSNNKEKKLSHVLKAMGLNSERIQSALRISLGRHTNFHEIDHFVESLSMSSKKLLSFAKL